MNLQEKKRALIKKIEESTSDDFISKLYYDVTRDETWDNSDEGKELILRLLQKSQQSIKESKTLSFDSVLNETKERYGLK